MSAISHTDWTVYCDHGGCSAQGRTDTLEPLDYTATGVRKVLRRRGWAVAVPQTVPGRRRDYCPEHKGDA